MFYYFLYKLLFCEKRWKCISMNGCQQWSLSYICLSPFGSFRACSPVKLVSELLSGKEWSPFLCTESSPVPDSPPYQIESEDTAQTSEDLQINAGAELDPGPDVFEGSPVAPEEETAYENIELSNVNTDEQQEMTRGLCSDTPQTQVESGANQMSE